MALDASAADVDREQSTTSEADTGGSSTAESNGREEAAAEITTGVMAHESVHQPQSGRRMGGQRVVTTLEQEGTGTAAAQDTVNMAVQE